jgi:phosphonate transport system substrate-binding protein
MINAKACNLKKILLFYICLPFLILIVSPIHASQDEVYSFGLIPQGPAFNMYKRWTPFIDKISEDTGIQFEIKVYDRVFEFENGLKIGLFDFAYLHPVQEAVAYFHQKYIPLVRSKRFCKGAMFVAKNSPVKKIEELKDKDIAFVSQRSLCSIVLRHALSTEKNFEDYNIIYSGSPSNVYKNVLLNKTAAGGTLDVALSRESKEVSSNLRSIYETHSMAPHPIAAHPRIPKKMRKKVTEAVIRIAQDDDGKKLLKTVRMPAPLMHADYNRDYRSLEKYVIE